MGGTVDYNVKMASLLAVQTLFSTPKNFLLTHPLWPMVSPEMPKNLISDFLFLSYWQKFKKMEKIDIFWLIFLFRKL